MVRTTLMEPMLQSEDKSGRKHLSCDKKTKLTPWWGQLQANAASVRMGSWSGSVHRGRGRIRLTVLKSRTLMVPPFDRVLGARRKRRLESVPTVPSRLV